MGEEREKPKASPKLTLWPLIALIFYEVSGGPSGVKDSVGAGGGPLLSLLGFLIFPLIWIVPEALDGGYVIWICSAFGPFWGFQEGLWKWFSGDIDNALYPVLFLDYLKHSFPAFNRLAARIPALLGITLSLTYLNYIGLYIVGISEVSLGVFSLFPFLVRSLLSTPKIRPSRWLVVDYKKVQWRPYFISMFWNLNYRDKASTLAGEVEDANRTFPKATFGAVVLMVSSYLIAILAGTGATNSSFRVWNDGYFAEVGMSIGGPWLKCKIGMLPTIFASRSKYGTPTVSILCSATGVIFLSWMSIQEILEFLNFLYAVGMLVEFAAFIVLRIKTPELHRPNKVPPQTFGVTLLCLPPALLLVLVMCLASLKTFFISDAVIVVGFCLYPLLIQAKSRKWIKFTREKPAVAPNISQPSNSVLQQPHCKPVEEASISLLSDVWYTKKN
ncbi:hypothetical protein K2173_002324 [Erythroxylum novogranatense]|uniref:Uncharacterized protein n=1 Tax=Erythroxylum novogranatense TaxID=1862640 RepID=A0AAV8TAS1_9ROSI|nr:hypothetical protein K2173_002324 [Erythroxylum novogranatense]